MMILSLKHCKDSKPQHVRAIDSNPVHLVQSSETRHTLRRTPGGSSLTAAAAGAAKRVIPIVDLGVYRI
jgi:hypothetical protein